LAFVLGSAPALVQGGGWRLTLLGPRAAPVDSPVIVEISSSIPVGVYEARGSGHSRPITAQIFDSSGKRWLGMVVPAEAKSGPYVLSALAATGNGDSGGFTLTLRESRISILVDGSLMTEYRTDVGAKPFLFPLVGPTGAGYTRAYPMENVPGEDRDHPHQRSFWFTHGKVNGVDFWSEEKGHGTIKETARELAVAGPVLVRLRTSNAWHSPDGRKVCSDQRVITIFRTRSTRVIDFEITLKAADGPVIFGDTKEGMFGLRVASSMDVDKGRGGKITNAEGLLDGHAWGRPSPWVDYTGPVGGRTVGIAILNHPRSFRYPTTWHVRTYGLFAANPFGWHDFGLDKSGEFTLAAGSLWFGYRVILHSGDTSEARLADAFATYDRPPRIEITAD
jgi:hypothetical protein